MRTARGFFLKLFVVSLCSAMILIALNALYVRGAYYQNIYGEVKKFQSVPYQIGFANFGTSHGVSAFRYSEPENRITFNFALSGEDIYHDFQTLKQFSDHLDEGCIVAIPISWFSFCLPTDTPSQKRYYTYLDKQYLIDFSYETLINARYLPVLRSIEFLFKNLIRDQELGVEQFMDEIPDRKTVESIAPVTGQNSVTTIDVARDQMIKALAAHAVTRSESWRSGRMVLGQKYMRENTELLIGMIEYCQEQDFVPVLLTIPVFRALRNDFSEEELDHYFYENVASVVSATGIDYIDYTRDERFIDEPFYFTNSDHMSQAGADAFYRAFRMDLDGLLPVTGQLGM